MAFIQSLTELIQSLFMSSSPEVKKRQALRKIENELKDVRPVFYKNGVIQVNFAEALRILYVNTRPVEDILSNTLCTEDLARNRHYSEQLLLTGFTSEAQDILVKMSYENRKAGALEAKSLNRYFESEHRELEKVVRELNTADFVKIDLVLDRLQQLNDICKYSYITALRLFDINFNSNLNYKPSFQPIPADLVETSLLDLYYVTADMDITNSLASAIMALAQLMNHGYFSEEKKRALMINLRQIQSILKHNFTSSFLTKLIRLAKKLPDFVPEKAVYHGNARQNYANYLEDRFNVDQSRLKTEIQDLTIKTQLKELFGENEMASLVGYNAELNAQLKQSTPVSFMWITPMQVLKTFVKNYYELHVKPLVNDVAIEGFFNNPAYKTEFSSDIYACNEIMEHIAKFEERFSRNNEFDEAIIVSLIHDSHRDKDFEIRLKALVEKINKVAKELIQTEVNNINALYKKLGEMLVDSKKPNSDVITNLKVLMISSRNRDNSDALEKQYPLWSVFIEIMKNYVIIGNIEKKV